MAFHLRVKAKAEFPCQWCILEPTVGFKNQHIKLSLDEILTYRSSGGRTVKWHSGTYKHVYCRDLQVILRVYWIEKLCIQVNMEEKNPIHTRVAVTTINAE